MMRPSSKSNSWLTRALVLFLMVLLSTTAFAEGRKRLVVLDFEGDDAEAIQKSLTKFLKKTHTVIDAEKWTSKADELSATKINEKNVKKVAKELKIDGIITANVEKRREEYIIRIKLRSGATGALGNQVNIKTDAPKLSKQAKSDVEEELFGQIDALKEVRGDSGGEEPAEEETKKDEKKESKFGKHDEEEKPTKDGKVGKEEKEEKNGKKDEKKEEKEALVTKKDSKKDEKKEEEENPLPKPKKESKKDEKKDEEAKEEKEEKKPKKVAKKKTEEETEEGVEEGNNTEGTEDASARAGLLSPGKRAVDAVIGLSINMRKLAFTYANDIGTRPAGYQGKPVPGGFFDMTVYPLALGHKRDDILTNIGFTGSYDQVLIVKSKDKAGNELKSAQSRFSVGAVFRYPFSKSASSPVIGARVRYGQQSFKITQPAPLPSVTYTIIDPGVFFRMPIGQKIVLDANAAFLAVTNTGQMQQADKYGAATVTGFEFNIGGDYNLTNTVFLRALFNYETIGYKFNGAAGTGMLPTATDNQKVSGARDSYYGAIITGGYLF